MDWKWSNSFYCMDLLKNMMVWDNFKCAKSKWIESGVRNVTPRKRAPSPELGGGRRPNNGLSLIDSANLLIEKMTNATPETRRLELYWKYICYIEK